MTDGDDCEPLGSDHRLAGDHRRARGEHLSSAAKPTLVRCSVQAYRGSEDRGSHLADFRNLRGEMAVWVHCIPGAAAPSRAGAGERRRSRKGFGMARLPRSRASCLVLALLLLTSSSLLAAGGRQGHQAAKPAASSVFSRAWAGLVSVVARLGSEMDPDGYLLGVGDNGSTMDPDGRHLPAVGPTSDLGSEMDPNGGK